VGLCGCVGPTDGVHDQAVPYVGRGSVSCVWPRDERHVESDSERTYPR